MIRNLAILSLTATPAFADAPQVLDATVEGDRVSVTLDHPDTGWDHYADGWRVETADGTVLGTRDLLHPHVEEMPFTRSLTGVTIPQDVREIFIRARCSVDGWSDTTLAVPLD